MTQHILWLHADPKRYFLLPEDFDFPPGDFTLLSLQDEEVRTDPAALAPFEISEEEATAQLGHVLETRFRELLRVFKSVPKNKAAKQWKAQGVSPEAATFLGVLQTLLEGVVQQDEALVERSRDQMRHLENALRAQGLTEELALDKLPEQLYRWFGATGDEAAMREVGTTLLSIVGGSQDESVPLGQRIDEALAELEKTVGRWIPAASRNEAEFREARARRVEEQARQDIAIALQAHGVEPIDFSHLFKKKEGSDNDEP